MICRIVISNSTCVVCFFFFFQAEDGIRDLTVTGVQTCALPILAGPGTRELAHPPSRRRTRALQESPRVGHIRLTATLEPRGPAAAVVLDAGQRSEERRVGEEGRSRGSPYHLKKKR